MKHVYKVILTAIPLSFLLGTWWGLRVEEQKKEASKSNYNAELRIVSQGNFFPPNLIKSFEQKHQIKVHIKEYSEDRLLLNEIFANGKNYDLFQVSSLHAKELINSNKLAKINHEELDNTKNISIDFLNLKFDPKNEYFIPLTWGVNFVVYNKQKITQTPESIVEVLKDQKYNKKVFLMPSSVELLNAIRHKVQVVNEWIRDDNVDLLNTEAKSLADQIQLSTVNPIKLLESEEVWFMQTPHGKASNLLLNGAKWGFFLPEEKSTLWIGLLGLPETSKMTKEAHLFMDYTLDKLNNLELVNHSKQATVLSSLNSSNLNSMQKANFLRKISLNKVDLLVDHEGFQANWQEVFYTQFSAFFED